MGFNPTVVIRLNGYTRLFKSTRPGYQRYQSHPRRQMNLNVIDVGRGERAERPADLVKFEWPAVYTACLQTHRVNNVETCT